MDIKMYKNKKDWHVKTRYFFYNNCKINAKEIKFYLFLFI